MRDKIGFQKSYISDEKSLKNPHQALRGLNLRPKSFGVNSLLLFMSSRKTDSHVAAMSLSKSIAVTSKSKSKLRVSMLAEPIAAIAPSTTIVFECMNPL